MQDKVGINGSNYHPVGTTKYVWDRGGPTVVISVFTMSNFIATSQNLDYTQASDKPFLYTLYSVNNILV
jgi:hypothetical protein